MSLFKGIGLLVFIYSLYCLFAGEMYVKDKWFGRTVKQSEEPGYFRTVIVCYIAVSVAFFF